MYDKQKYKGMAYIKEFDQWNKKKKQADGKEIDRNLFLHEREVWWCSVGVNVGVEIDGKNNDFERPVLLIKKFNGLMFWGIPLTSKAKENPYILRVVQSRGVSYANLSQLRLFSSKRILRKVGVISEKSFLEVLNRLRECF
jgi:mRNA interferase MazF